MSNTDYQLYSESVQRLTDTLIIKSDITAERLNLKVSEVYQMAVGDDPRTWLYYMNLAGEYHPCQTMMTVNSLDTLEEIEFTKENMLRHRMTAREYAYGGDYFNRLIARYPEQRMLILGILNPIDIEKAIAARNHEILWYDTREVESREANLIPRLQQEIDDYFRRWEHPAYESVDMLHWPALYAILFTQIPEMIKGIRWENCHTHYAHSFHIWSYLASHQGLDRFKRYMTESQMLWFYRNIAYVERNMGRTENYDKLIQKVLTDRGIPIGAFSIKQDASEIPQALKPTVYMERKPLNLQEIVGNGTVRRKVTTVMQQQFPLARDNEAEYYTELNRTIEKMSMHDNNTLTTKVLESEAEDLTDSELYPKYDFLLNEWIHLSSIGMYQSRLTTTNPVTGDTMTMSMKDAYKLFLYLLNYSMGMTLIEVPKIHANHVRVLTLPTFEHLRSITDPVIIPDKLIWWCLDKQVTLRPIVSTEEFLNIVTEIYQGWRRHQFMYQLQEHYQARGMAEAIVENFYMDVGVDFGIGQLYKEWFLAMDWELDAISQEEAGILALDIFTKATGQDLEDVTSLKDIQYGMLQLLKTLSSYTIHFIQTINSDPIKPLNKIAVRLGSSLVSGSEELWEDWAQANVHDTDNQATEVIKFVHDNNPMTNWRESAVESLEAPPKPTWCDCSGYENTQTVRFSTQYWAQVISDPISLRFRKNPLDGLWLAPFPGRAPRDISERIPSEAVRGLTVKPIKPIEQRFRQPGLQGLWINPIYKRVEGRFRSAVLSETNHAAYKPISMRLSNPLNRLIVKPLPTEDA